jgi:dynein heavy chain
MEKANAFNTHVINPKALTIKEIYGYSDLISKEWTEGVLGEVFRRCSQSVQLDQRHCIIFDGAVSTDWIENMNTVLDDNRKLCLMNAESIPMTNMMTMVFEVDDLQHASPATVSRCGMVYVPPNTLPYQALLHTYFL